MTQSAWRKRERMSVMTAAFVTSLLGSVSHVAAQSAQQAPSEAVPLPPLVVEGAAAKSKSAPKKKVQAAKTPSAPAPAQPSSDAPAGEGQSSERAKGPVNGYSAGLSATATKTDTPILETPQSISVVTQDQISDQQARTIADALRYTPGITVDGFGPNVFFDSIKVRGFNAPQYLDGLRLPSDASAFAVPRIETYGLERLEVLKGPSSGLYGQSEPGGLINMVSKRPLDTPHFEVVGTTGSFDRLEGAFDVGGPVSTNPNLLYRVVGLARESDSEIDYQENNKLFIAPSVTWRASSDTSLTLLSQYQKIENNGYQQYVPGEVTLLSSPFGRIPRSRYLGEPGFDKYELSQWSIGYELEHRIQPGLQFRQHLRYFDITQDMQAMRGDFMVGTQFVRTPIYVNADASNFAVDNQLQADFTTGPLKHTVLAGLDYQNTRSSNVSVLANDAGDYRPIDVFNPVYGAFPIPTRSDLGAFLDIDSHLEQTGLYVQDQIKLEAWTLSLSGRQDWSKVDTVSRGLYPPSAFSPYERNDSAQTGRVGLSYLFDFGVAPYISYSTSFVPNATSDISGTTFKPTTGEGKEIGIKFMPNGTNLMFTAALFDITQQDILTPDPATGGLTSLQTDEARVRGFEFEVRGNVTRELEIVGGYSKLDPKISESSASPAANYEGNYLPNVNLEQASLWAKYTWYDGPLAGFGIGGGIRYVGENYGDQANLIYIPSYTVLDATASYDFRYLDPKLDGWQAQINATNLEDEYYVASCQSGLAYCGLGAGRTVLGTLKYSWK